MSLLRERLHEQHDRRGDRASLAVLTTKKPCYQAAVMTTRLSPRWFYAILVVKDPGQEYLARAKVWRSILQ